MTNPSWHAVIADDNPADIHQLKTLLKDHCPHVAVKAEVCELNHAVDRIQALEPNLVFCNVSLENGTAFDLSERLKGSLCHRIFMSLNEQDALRSFRYHAFDFLLKPIQAANLLEVMGRLEKEVLPTEAPLELLEEIVDGKKFTTIILKVAGVQHLVQITDIAHLEGDGNYSTVHLASGEKILVSKPLKHFEDILPAKHFFRVHQSHIVNLQNVKSVQNGDFQFIHLRNGEKAPLARRKREPFLAWLGKQVLR